MKKILTIVGIVIVALAVLAVVISDKAVFQGTTNLDSLTLSSDLTVGGVSTITGTTTLGNVVVQNTGTSSLIIAAGTATGTCIQMVTTSGSTTKITFTGTTSPAIAIAAGTCK